MNLFYNDLNQSTALRNSLWKTFFLLVYLYIPVLSSAQDTLVNVVTELDTFDFDLKKYKGKGEFEFVKKKSTVTDSYYQVSLPKGEWKFFDANDVLRISGYYKIKSGESLKTGKWEYYDTQGDVLMSEEFPSGKKLPFYAKPFILKTPGGYDIINYNDENVMEVEHYLTPLPDISDPFADRLGVVLYEDNYDTLIAMDARNPDKWLVIDQNPKKLKEDLNLVENPGFENNDGLMKIQGYQIDDHITHWRPSAGTPDYYNSPRFNAIEGNASIGCRFYAETGRDIEFISTALKETLEYNQMYCLKVFVRLKGDCFYGVNALGALLSSDIPGDQELIFGKRKPTLKHNGGSVLSYKTQWMQLSCSYVATGNESYLTLGSFANADSMGKQKLKGNIAESYYFFDNIQLYAIDSKDECPCNLGKGKDIPIQPPLETGKSFVIKNIFFENDAWELLPASFRSLDSLYDVLTINSFKKIEISGHTSSTGSRERNILLSKNRAEAVKEYLVNKGLNEDLFLCKGYGPTKPIADNSTELGQAENRRVEFKILE